MQTVFFVPVDPSNLHPTQENTLGTTFGITRLMREKFLDNFFIRLKKLTKENPFPDNCVLETKSDLDYRGGKYIAPNYLSNKANRDILGYVNSNQLQALIDVTTDIPAGEWVTEAVFAFLKKLPQHIKVVIVW